MADKSLDSPVSYAGNCGKLGKVGEGAAGTPGDNGRGSGGGDAGNGIKLIGAGGVDIEPIGRGIQACNSDTTGKRHHAHCMPGMPAPMIPENDSNACGGNQYAQHDCFIGAALHDGNT